ncbi:hypothetical protein NPS53_09190 [Pseudomonas putida]|uniref:hypothetical protein n=1 Tax=Pseudomonas putida TaxID=303 RepID=UPI00236418CB|nr:hypothetical protein [Pseudomonas putida]MDD2139750.1 hypothetical protein [Pseudomonas putida]HDS1721674.1 hypothetical protein [Pseudomonas putida]
MTRKVNAVAFGSTLLIGAFVLAVVGYQSVMGVNRAILKAFLKAPKAGGYDLLLAEWGDMLVPLVLCLAAPIAALVVGSIMAFRGDLSISYRAPLKPVSP